jgi:phosphatidate cytidylyltransferase
MEGAIAGLFLAILTGLIFLKFLNIKILQIIFLSAFLSIFAQIGDLFESIIKRDLKVKDSSKMPAFGGILDMLDSMLFSSCILFFFLESL